VTLQITDRDNSPYPGGPGPGTVAATTFGMTVPCTPTPDPGIGATCALATSVNSLVPGAAVERKRAIWQLGAVDVYDSGPDGDAATTQDNSRFATQGLFVP
jgi:hypothetical protein